MISVAYSSSYMWACGRLSASCENANLPGRGFSVYSDNETSRLPHELCSSADK